MNILILQGSPRANGNTAWMAEEYLWVVSYGRRKAAFSLRFRCRRPDHLSRFAEQIGYGWHAILEEGA